MCGLLGTSSVCFLGLQGRPRVGEVGLKLLHLRQQLSPTPLHDLEPRKAACSEEQDS